MSRIQENLKATIAEIQNLKRVRKHYEKTQIDLDSAYDQLDLLADQLDKEYQDLKQLENLSMKSLFHKVLGSKEEQIEKERQEYLQATLKYNAFKKNVEILEFEKTVLEKKLGDVSLLENKLKTLKKEREKELLRSGSEIGNKLLILHKKEDSIELLTKEFSEAIAAGSKSVQVIEKMMHFLEQARNWGNWDMMGKGRMASYNKHSAIDNAREVSYSAKHLLDRFQQELYDIGGPGNYNFNIELNSLQNFTDIFFDNLISDWIMQQKIKNALANVNSVRDKVVRILQSLNSEQRNFEKQLSQINHQKEQLILSS